MNSAIHELALPPEAAGQRIDKWLSTQLRDSSRSQLQKLISEGHCSIDGKIITNSSQKISGSNQTLVLNVPEVVALDLSPVEMDLNILYEDDDLIVINKRAGLTVHPAPGERNATLVHGLLAHCGDSLSGIGGVARPGIVHRLDKDTSGAMIVAKNDHAHHHLSDQLKERTLSRTYHALCFGEPKAHKGTIDGPIARARNDRKKMAIAKNGEGKAARTHYKLVERLCEGHLSLIECKLESGRTHQIRVHMTHLGHKLIGDPTYGRARKLADIELQKLIDPFEKQMLHAVTIAFDHPTKHERLTFHAPYREEFSLLLQNLRAYIAV